jgi:hypothetical protein
MALESVWTCDAFPHSRRVYVLSNEKLHTVVAVQVVIPQCPAPCNTFWVGELTHFLVITRGWRMTLESVWTCNAFAHSLRHCVLSKERLHTVIAVQVVIPQCWVPKIQKETDLKAACGLSSVEPFARARYVPRRIRASRAVYAAPPCGPCLEGSEVTTLRMTNFLLFRGETPPSWLT